MDDESKLEFANTLPLTRRYLAVMGLLSVMFIFILMSIVKWYPPVLAAAVLVGLIAVIIIVKGKVMNPVSIRIESSGIVLRYSSGKETVVKPEQITVVSPADVVYPGCYGWGLTTERGRQWGFVAVGRATQAMFEKFPETRDKLSGGSKPRAEPMQGKGLSAQGSRRFRRILIVNVIVTAGIFIPLVLLVFSLSFETVIATVLMLVIVDGLMTVFLYAAMKRSEG